MEQEKSSLRKSTKESINWKIVRKLAITYMIYVFSIEFLSFELFLIYTDIHNLDYPTSYYFLIANAVITVIPFFIAKSISKRVSGNKMQNSIAGVLIYSLFFTLGPILGYILVLEIGNLPPFPSSRFEPNVLNSMIAKFLWMNPLAVFFGYLGVLNYEKKTKSQS